MPDESFILVDDYWYSFIMSHKLGRKLRKLSTKGFSVLSRTDDSGKDSTGCVRDREKKKKYRNPDFLGFFGFVKTIKLLITQKKLRHKHKIKARA